MRIQRLTDNQEARLFALFAIAKDRSGADTGIILLLLLGGGALFGSEMKVFSKTLSFMLGLLAGFVFIYTIRLMFRVTRQREELTAAVNAIPKPEKIPWTFFSDV